MLSDLFILVMRFLKKTAAPAAAAGAMATIIDAPWQFQFKEIPFVSSTIDSLFLSMPAPFNEISVAKPKGPFGAGVVLYTFLAPFANFAQKAAGSVLVGGAEYQSMFTHALFNTGILYTGVRMAADGPVEFSTQGLVKWTACLTVGQVVGEGAVGAVEDVLDF